MNVLSLFDGISCGYVALKRAGIIVDNYYASEIDKNAITVALDNFPDIIQIGDVTKVSYSNGILKADKEYNVVSIDLLIGGSPCQGFSTAGKGLNFEDSRSKLFFEYIRLLHEVKPKYFLLENVVMKKEWQDIITEYLGVEPIEINSALVSAQNRRRLYWTNIPNVSQPEDKHIVLSDILEDVEIDNCDGLDCSVLHKASIIGRRLNEQGHRQDYDKSVPITQCIEVRKTNTDKSQCLTTVDKDNVLTPLPYGRHTGAFTNNLPFRYYTRTEYERLQTLPDGYTKSISESCAKKAMGNAWTVDVIAHILKGVVQ